MISRSTRGSSRAALGATLLLAAASGLAGAQTQSPVQAPPPPAPAAAGAGAAPAAAEGASLQSPILTLNREALFAKSALGKRIVADLERDRTTLAAENRRIETDLGAEERQLTEQRATLPAAEFSRLASEFDAKVQRLRQSQDRKSRVLQQRLDSARQSFVSEAGPVLAAIARERGAVAILDTTVVLMSFDVIDITDEAVARLDAAIGDGTGEVDGALHAPFPVMPDPQLRPLPRVLPDLPAADALPTGGDGSGALGDNPAGPAFPR